jgi:hypothetical protein
VFARQGPAAAERALGLVAHRWPELEAGVVNDDWIRVSRPVDTHEESRWSLLRANQAFDGAARVAGDGNGGLEVGGEIAIDDRTPDALPHEHELDRRVAGLCDDVAAAARRLSGGPPPDDTPVDSPPTDDDGALVQWSAEAGWAASPLAPGRASCPLEVAGDALSLTLALGPEGRLHAVVVLSRDAVTSPVSQEAIARLLLDATAHLRTIKGVVVRERGEELPGLAVAAERRPANPATLQRALAALSVASAVVGREVQALVDERLARDYLLLRDRHATLSANTRQHSREEEDTPCLQLP